MANVTFHWVQGSPADLAAAVERYGRKVLDAAAAAGKIVAAEAEDFATSYAPWTDRTGAARAGLHGWCEQAGAALVIIYLAHGVDYGKWLEIAMGMRYQIILPALESVYGRVFEEIRNQIGR